jgi:hypothetical protein
MRRTFCHLPLSVLVTALAVGLVVLPACGDDSGSDQATGGTTADGGGSSDTTGGDETTTGGGQAGGGTATLTIGDETWTFDTVRCAFGEETQSDEWDFVLSAIQDGLQLSADRAADTGQYGDDVQLDDIEDFENPSVSWSAPAFDPTSGSSGDEPFLEVDGKEVRAETTFTDGIAADSGTLPDPVPGTLEATCP